MDIQSVVYANEEGTLIRVNDEYLVERYGRYELRIEAWLAEGNTIDPYVPEPELTNEELIDQAGPVLVAFIKAFAKREGLTLAQVKAAIIAEM